ncbi:P-loop NTPase fold protein [Achromobacter dolens]|uniref:P-loop NTPase fold protein n=1 Tax=Achromobacter dolens TaxID=1287738 RepID=UPI0031D1B94A
MNVDPKFEMLSSKLPGLFRPGARQESAVFEERVSLKQTKEHLAHLLTDPDNRVIALAGKWGTGKTHLWREVMLESTDEAVKGALYVSLFGISSIDQVKRKLIEAVAPSSTEHPQLWESTKRAVSSGLKALESFHKGFSAINELGVLLIAPALLREKVIVIDDIERKHEKLGADEILGFIDEYTQRHDTRFILILNSDQLDTRKTWDTLREKVIDQELKLLISPDEAFSIASQLTPTPYADSILSAIATCKLTNIRIIRKIISATNRILANRSLTAPLQRRTVPSVVLLAAIHYKGIEDGPDFHFVLNVASAKRHDPNSKKELTEEEKSRARWRLLVHSLGIYGCDEFEELVVEFLESGLLASEALQAIIDRYIAEQENFEARDSAHQFVRKAYWDHSLSDRDLLNMASGLPRIAGLLDPYVCTEIHQLLQDIPGGACIGQSIVEEWVTTFKAKEHVDSGFESPFARPLHPLIASAMEASRSGPEARTTLFDACMYIFDNSGWGARQQLALSTATTSEFESEIRTMDISHLERFMPRMLEMVLKRQTYDPHFGSATEHFVEACKSIIHDPTAGRLARLIQRIFEDAGLSLDMPPAG